MDEPRIKYTYPTFPEQTQPKGNLLPDLGSQACWWYYTLAHKNWVETGKSIDDQFGLLEGEPWMDHQFEQIARSVAVVYGFKDPSEFMAYWPTIAAECSRLEMHQPVPCYMKPLRIVV